jgi:phosphomannomutase
MPDNTPIVFGTDGWRARMDGDFNESNVHRVAHAYAAYVLEHGAAKQGVVIGYDCRDRSDIFADLAAGCLSQRGIEVWLSNAACPTPAVSVAITKLRAFGGMVITASHNPAAYNGLKIKDQWGKSASGEITAVVQNNLDKPFNAPAYHRADIKNIDLLQIHRDRLVQAVSLDLIQKQPLRVLVNCLYGSGSGIMKALFHGSALRVTEMNDQRDVTFGGVNPEPLEANVRDMQARMKKQSFDIGLVYDGDADRIGLMDSDGRLLTTQDIFVLLLWHLTEHKKLKGRVVKSFNITDRVERLARRAGCDVTVTPIGFKHIAPYLLEARTIMGGEESGGFAVRYYMPERDGIFCGLLLLEAMTQSGKGIEALLAQAAAEIGESFYQRVDIHLSPAIDKQALIEKIKNPSGMQFASLEIQSVETLDGIKYRFGDGQWILFRFSGTEQLLRIYAEGPSKEWVENLLRQAQEQLKE